MTCRSRTYLGAFWLLGQRNLKRRESQGVHSLETCSCGPSSLLWSRLLNFATDAEAPVALSRSLLGVQQHPWLLPTPCQGHSPLRCDSQTYFQIFPNVQGEAGKGQNHVWFGTTMPNPLCKSKHREFPIH